METLKQDSNIWFIERSVIKDYLLTNKSIRRSNTREVDIDTIINDSFCIKMELLKNGTEYLFPIEEIQVRFDELFDKACKKIFTLKKNPYKIQKKVIVKFLLKLPNLKNKKISSLEGKIKGSNDIMTKKWIEVQNSVKEILNLDGNTSFEIK